MGKQYAKPLAAIKELSGPEIVIARKLKQLQNGVYTFRNQEVADFITIHPFLIGLLEDARSKIQVLFNFSPLFLEVIDDPDFPDSAHLTLFISTNLNINEALERLNQLKKTWWYGVISTLQPYDRGLLNLNLEFQSNEF
jgi:hypothetical protein